MPNAILLKKYAELTVKVGVNVQKEQPVVIRATTETKEFVRALTTAAYEAGAKYVYVQWSDDYVGRDTYLHAKVEDLEYVPNYVIEQQKYFLEQGACFISVTSPVPGLNAVLDPVKVQRASVANQKALSFFQTFVMGNKTQWVVVAAPNQVWAEQVFTNLKGTEAVEALWDAIFSASRVTLENDPIEAWNEHNKTLAKHSELLNKLNFKSLHFKNSLGTDLTVELVKNHIWAAGGEVSATGVYFNPNIPTEEAFTMPYKFGTKGRVYATKPLNYQGRLIDGFWLEFKDGKVVDFDAEKEKDTLKNIIEADQNSAYIGEIALISHDSPISNTNILFLNTLFDENASCHMALGRAYPMNIKGGLEASIEELEKQGYNHSIVHVDFMFGSSDMEIIGEQYDGSKVKIFENGNFII
ncbi:MAG TPA: aminopeptidase [Acholeplasma sp.]|jgi:aminopeptidase|nr:aminopeptidase [Acholeplasma sp.]